MKKFLLVLAIFLFSNTLCLAYDIDLTKEGQYQKKKIMEMGFSILNANRIEKRIIFKYSNDKQANAFAVYSDKSVIILRGLLPYVDDDSELAGIISHEIAHNVDYYGGFFRYLAMTYSPKKYEIKADKKAVDYMVKAGYNPVALIVIFNKFSGQIQSSSHPLTSERLAYIYEYIYQKYPAYLAQNDYRENIYYQNFLLTSRDAREKIRNKNVINVSDKTKKSL